MEARYTNSDAETLRYMYFDCPCFFGQITRDQAKEILEGKPNGSYLIREKDLTRENNDFRFEEIFKIGGKCQNFSLLPKCSLRYWQDYWRSVYGEIEGVRRTKPFSLQELCRAKILASGITEDGINQLELPVSLKKYLKE